MTVALLLSIVGLALLDSLNPATIGGVALILLAPGTGQTRTAAAFVAGAYATVATAGVLVFFAAATLGSAIQNGLDLVRAIALTVAAVAVAVAGVRRLRTRHRQALQLPAWLNARTAPALAVLVTAADLPNAFPYLIAIERLITAEVPTATALMTIAMYALIYCLPCLLLLLIGVSHGDRVRARLGRVYDKFGSARDVPANRYAAVGYWAVAAAVLTFAWAPQ